MNVTTFRQRSTWVVFFCLMLPLAGRGAAPISLRAGPLTMLFEPDNAFLRYVKLDRQEVLHGVYAPVRNQFWGTVRPQVGKLEVEDGGDHFTLKFEAVCRERDIDFVWNGVIKGSAAGVVEFTFDGTARSTFQRNRIGFCILHPAAAAGQPWIIETVDGQKTKGHFPTYISPHQPARMLREVAQQLSTNLWAHVRMEGDTFEMEDQRNWTDASFKTYCTPLEIPYPVVVAKGTRISQKITLRLAGDVPKFNPEKVDHHEPIVLSLTSEQTRLPRLGLQVSSQTSELSALELKRLKALHLDHLRVDLALTNNQFMDGFRHAVAQARALGVKLHVGLRLGPSLTDSLDRLLVEARRAPVAVWLIIGAEPVLFREARRKLQTLGGKAVIGSAHEDINFTQLNRVRPASDMMDVAAYGVTPQIHAFDNLSIMETLPILADTVRSGRQFVKDTPILVTPITLRLQTEAQVPLPGELPSSVDARQRTPFAASWTLGSIKFLSEAGVQSLTYYETVGWKGVMENSRGSLLPEKFPSQPDELFPVYQVLREVNEFAGGSVRRFDASDNFAVAGLALVKGNRLRLLVANLADHELTVALRGLGEEVEIHRVGSTEINPAGQPSATRKQAAPAAAMELPLTIPPYGIVRIDRTLRR